ncbi:MAG TPA: CDP-glycerol glycerophosphotransferase family protein [Mycobacteriales bacterium]|nr:CDP-glycerol glycerophosphotransferase family protein [Mycobacteriales bacterium]
MDPHAAILRRSLLGGGVGLDGGVRMLRQALSDVVSGLVLASSALLLLALIAAITAAATGSGWGTVVALAISGAAEMIVRRRWTAVECAAVRMLAVVLLAARTAGAGIVIGSVVMAGLVVTAIAVAGPLRAVTTRLQRPQVVTRNLDGLVIPRITATWLTTIRGLAETVGAVGLAAAASGGGRGAAIGGLAAGTSLAVLPVARLAERGLALVRAGLRGKSLEVASDALRRLQPQVVLYFAGGPSEVYQVRMWLEPVARLGRPALVVLRDFDVLDALGPTTLPVLCTPYNGTLARLPLAEPVVTLFVTHSGNNHGMLRRPEIRSVFVGHGDSDKPDSVNRNARVYDEVWVAGPLGRRRYAESGIGVDDSRIVEIGRPQAQPTSRAPDDPPTIVYAPTWEGWGDDPHHSSLAHAGPALVRALQAAPGIRVRYRPHPLTGKRDPALRQAHREILRLLDGAVDTAPLEQTLGSCAGLIADVSSVVNDFLVFDRPYAVVDTRGLGPAAMRRQFPSTAGGFVISPDLGGLTEFLAAATGGSDPTQRARRKLLRDALGDPATAQQRFADAVERLLAKG